MKNIIKIDVNNPYYFQIANVDNGDNSIFIQFTNYTEGGKCEIYYGDAFYTQIEVGDDGLVEIPAECYSDDANMHIRYTSDMTTCFTHITGDGSKYEDMVLIKIANCIAGISGTNKTVITDYSTALSGIISNHTKNDSKSCYEDLERYRKSLISSINSMGGTAADNATINDLVVSLIDLDVTLSTGKVIIADAITSKGVETSSTDSFEVMAKNINDIQTDIYGLIGTWKVVGVVDDAIIGVPTPHEE